MFTDARALPTSRIIDADPLDRIVQEQADFHGMTEQRFVAHSAKMAELVERAEQEGWDQ